MPGKRPSIPLLTFLLFSFLPMPAEGREGEKAFRLDRENALEQLLTPEERQYYRQKLWELKTEVERERFRTEQRQLLEERARALVVLPGAGPFDGKEQEAMEQKKPWPDDGLRRWPAARRSSDTLQRWPGAKEEAAEQAKKDPWRHWPEKRKKVAGERAEGRKGP